MTTMSVHPGPVRHGLGGLGGLRLRGAGTQRKPMQVVTPTPVPERLAAIAVQHELITARREVVLQPASSHRRSMSACVAFCLKIGVNDVAIEFHNILHYEEPLHSFQPTP